MQYYFIVACAFCALLNISCNNNGMKDKVVGKTIIKSNETIKPFGYDFTSILNSSFGEVEKKLNYKTQVDTEVAIIFIDTKKDLIKKEYKTKRIDNVTISYGPIEDTLLYKTYLSIKPNAIILYGTLSIKENEKTKNIILSELQNIMPKQSQSNAVIEKISEVFIKGHYDKNAVYVIDFEIKDYPIAEFAIGYLINDQIFYKYTFSKVANIYP